MLRVVTTLTRVTRPRSIPPKPSTSFLQTGRCFAAAAQHGLPTNKENLRSARKREPRFWCYDPGSQLGDERFLRTHDRNNASCVPIEDAHDPASWTQLFDKFLPAELRSAGTAPTTSSNNHESIASEIVQILEISRKKVCTGRNLIPWLVLNGRDKAASHLVAALLKPFAARGTRSKQRTPSNIAWPSGSLTSALQGPISVDTLEYTAFGGLQGEELNDDRDLTRLQEWKMQILTTVWISLGDLVMQVTDLPEEQRKGALNTALLVFGLIHNLGLIPENVYNYSLSPYSSTIQRPPILHLLCSRILTALSDATWRENQDELIAQATRMGTEFRELRQNPPGGRFRLKVRPLEPEVWLELILWCCVEGGYRNAAVNIIKTLSNKANDPWFAIRWSPNHGDAPNPPLIEWDRVKTRHGGAVGLIEGYSRERPFVEVPSRTISVEVVLATVEAIIDSLAVSSEKTNRSPSLELAQRDIVTVISFLEPHKLAPEYFDYLGVRLLQTGAFDADRSRSAFKSWSDSLLALRQLEHLPTPQTSTSSLSLETIFEHSECHAGISHQAMDAAVQAGDIHQTLAVFNDLQKFVDRSKLNAIANFLRAPVSTGDKFFSARPFLSDQEYVDSHGQLPPYKLAGLLNLITDTRMIGLGQWLLYAEDVDGPLIPQNVYATPALISPLIRFAAESNDAALLQRVISASQASSFKPTVNVLRNLVNAHIALLDFSWTAYYLQQLRDAQGGGYSPNNVAHLGACVLRIEANLQGLNTEQKDRSLGQALTLLDDVLKGHFNSSRADFRRAQSTLFKQQTAQLLRVFARCDGSYLQMAARKYTQRFTPRNEISLPATVFNVVLATILETKGVMEGKKTWEMFCKDPSDDEAEPQPGSEDIRFEDDTASGIALGLEAGSANPDSEHELELEWSEDGRAEMTSPHTEDVPMSDISLDVSERDTTQLARLQDLTKPNRDLDLNLDSTVPVTRPDLRTLRLIVRSAVAEKSSRRTENLSTSHVNQILQWAVDMFKRFDAPPGIIEQEIQEPIREDLLASEDLVEPVRPRRVLGTIVEKSARRRSAQQQARERGVRHDFQGRLKTRLPKL